ncbi:MAG: hypothetical protein WD672_07475 [Woeseia sp.]
MNVETQLTSFGDEEMYNFVRRGSFGRFQTGDSFPVEYLMTTFTPAEASERLTFARDISTAHLDFELLMQRDIDEDRVREDMEPYLNRRKQPISERRDVVFFPPLLAAIVPVEEERMLELYSDEAFDSSGTKYTKREWSPFFKLTYMNSTRPDALRLSKGESVATVDRQQVEMSLRIPGSDQKGVKLVVIDGQHRLLAIQRVLQSAREQLKDLILPVCIVFPPLATARTKKELEPAAIMTVPQVFRSLFVDVNETMRNVGGHFTILLSDDYIPDLVCRHFCAGVLRDRGEKYLATVEWNIKTRKQSYDLNREYSLTSIGILSKSLKAVLSKVARLKYVLNIPEVEEQLFVVVQ